MLSTLDFTLGFTQEEKPQLGTQRGHGDAGGSPPLQPPSIQPGATFTLGMSWALRVHTQPSPLLMAAPGVSPPRHCFAASDLESSCLTVMQPQHCYVLLQLAAVMFCFYYLKQLCIGGHGTSLLTCFPSHLEYYEQHQFQHSHWGLPRETHWYEA